MSLLARVSPFTSIHSCTSRMSTTGPLSWHCSRTSSGVRMVGCLTSQPVDGRKTQQAIGYPTVKGSAAHVTWVRSSASVMLSPGRLNVSNSTLVWEPRVPIASGSIHCGTQPMRSSRSNSITISMCTYPMTSTRLCTPSACRLTRWWALTQSFT